MFRASRSFHRLRKLAIQPLEDRALMAGTVGFLSTDVAVTEMRDAVIVEVSRSGDGNVTVQFSAGGGTALHGNDYIAASGTLTFAPGDFQELITVPILDNAIPEPNETFQLTLSSPTGGAELDIGVFGDRSTLNVTIYDDDTLHNPDSIQLPGEGYNAIQFLPNGQPAQILWLGEDLIYRERQLGGDWRQELVTSALRYHTGYLENSFEPYRDREQAQLLIDRQGRPHILALNDYGVEHFQRTSSGWQANQATETPRYESDHSFTAAIGRDDSLHLLLHNDYYDYESGVSGARLYYATNKSGAWLFETVAETGQPRDFFRQAYAPRFLSLAVDSQGFAHVAYTPRFDDTVNPDGTSRPFSQLAYATNRSGSWVSQIVSQPADESGDAGLGASIAVGPGDQVAIAHFYNERVASGSPQFSRLLYHVRQPHGQFATETIASAPDGYVAGDGANFTGFAPLLRFDIAGRPNVVFSDHAAEHFGGFGADEFGGQIRHAIKMGDVWQLQTLLRQTNPVVNQMVYPMLALSPREIVVAGLARRDTLGQGSVVLSSEYVYQNVHVYLSQQRPDLRQFYDETTYLRYNPDVRQAMLAGHFRTGFDHFVSFGHREGRRFSLLYDESIYRRANPDVAQAVAAGFFASGYEHFALFGHRESKTFGLLFSEHAYRRFNPDVDQAINAGFVPSAFAHYMSAGRFEGRRFSEFYDDAFYRAQNPDVVQAEQLGLIESALAHFVDLGQAEQRAFSKYFDERMYRIDHPDVAAAIAAGGFRSGLEHYVLFGRRVGWTPRPLFDEQTYLAHNPDVVQAIANGHFNSGLSHFITFGRFEVRRSSPYFDESFYLAQYPDVAGAVASDAIRSGLDHFLIFGQFEGRIGAPPE